MSALYQSTQRASAELTRRSPLTSPQGKVAGVSVGVGVAVTSGVSVGVGVAVAARVGV